jgi:hypothetical protein
MFDLQINVQNDNINTVKRKICSVIKEFFLKDTHTDPKSKIEIKFDLSTRGQIDP